MRRSNFTTSTLALVIGGLLASGIMGESAFANNTSSADLRQGLPGRRISGGSRQPSTACLTTPEQRVVALVPENNLGLTLSERPSVWVSLPAVSPDRTLEFGLFNQAGETVYRKTLEASGEAGLTRLTLPSTESPLAINENYRWYLSVVCNPAARAEDLAVTGWIKRIEPESGLYRQLTDATSKSERLSLYEESAVWYDALNTLIELRQESPASPELANQWTLLLESINLTQTLGSDSETGLFR